MEISVMLANDLWVESSLVFTAIYPAEEKLHGLTGGCTFLTIPPGCESDSSESSESSDGTLTDQDTDNRGSLSSLDSSDSSSGFYSAEETLSEDEDLIRDAAIELDTTENRWCTHMILHPQAAARADYTLDITVIDRHTLKLLCTCNDSLLEYNYALSFPNELDKDVAVEELKRSGLLPGGVLPIDENYEPRFRNVSVKVIE